MANPLTTNFSKMFRSVSKKEWKSNSHLPYRAKRIIQLLRRLEWLEDQEQRKMAVSFASH